MTMAEIVRHASLLQELGTSLKLLELSCGVVHTNARGSCTSRGAALRRAVTSRTGSESSIAAGLTSGSRGSTMTTGPYVRWMRWPKRQQPSLSISCPGRPLRACGVSSEAPMGRVTAGVQPARPEARPLEEGQLMGREKSPTCGTCSGTGTVEHVKVKSGGETTRTTHTCPICKGTGTT